MCLHSHSREWEARLVAGREIDARIDHRLLLMSTLPQIVQRMFLEISRLEFWLDEFCKQ